MENNGKNSIDLNTPEKIIEVKNLNKFYGSKHILKDVSFNVNKGDVISIVGPSGSGKSTILKCLNFLEKPNSGDILFHGKNVGKTMKNGQLVNTKERDLLKYRAKVGMVFQHFNLFPHMTGLENIIEAAVFVNKMDRKDAVEEAKMLLNKVLLYDKEKSYPSQLSGGEQQRVAIARALIMHPEVILFDEATSALDPETVGEVLKTMSDLARDGMTMVVVSHEMQFVRESSKETIFLYNGSILEHGRTEDVLSSDKLECTRFFSRITDYRESHS